MLCFKLTLLYSNVICCESDLKNLKSTLLVKIQRDADLRHLVCFFQFLTVYWNTGAVNKDATSLQIVPYSYYVLRDICSGHLWTDETLKKSFCVGGMRVKGK